MGWGDGMGRGRGLFCEGTGGALRDCCVLCREDHMSTLVCKIYTFFLHGVLRRPSFFLVLSASGKQGGRGHITMHVWIPAEPGGGALSIQRRSAGSFCQGVVFRLAEAMKFMENPTLFFFSKK